MNSTKVSVHEWLRSLKDEHRELFIEKCQNSVSIVELHLYSKMLNPAWSGSISELHLWYKEFYYEKDLKHTLISEASKLENDINYLRSLINDIPNENAPVDFYENSADADIQRELSIKATTEVMGKIAALQQQLRGHVTSILQIKATQDSTLLKLEGAEMIVASLMETFASDPEMLHIIEQTSIAVTADIVNHK